MADGNGAVKTALAYLDKNLGRFTQDLVALSKIPSISAQGFPPEEVRRSADAQEGIAARLARRKPSFKGR